MKSNISTHFVYFQEAAKKEPIDQRILAKLEELVQTGITSCAVLHSLTSKYVETELFKDRQAPPRSRRRFYPSMKDIQNFITRSRRKREKEHPKPAAEMKRKKFEFEEEEEEEEDDILEQDELMGDEEEEEGDGMGVGEGEIDENVQQGGSETEHSQDVLDQCVPVPEHRFVLGQSRVPENTCVTRQSHVLEAGVSSFQNQISGIDTERVGSLQKEILTKDIDHVSDQSETNDLQGQNGGEVRLGIGVAGHVYTSVSNQVISSEQILTSEQVLSSVTLEQVHSGEVEQCSDNIPEQLQGCSSRSTEQVSVSEQDYATVPKQISTTVPSKQVTISKHRLDAVPEQACNMYAISTEQIPASEKEYDSIQQQISTSVPSSQQVTISEQGLIEQACTMASVSTEQVPASEQEYAAALQQQVSSLQDQLPTNSAEEQAKLLALMNTMLLNSGAQDVAITTTSAPIGESTILFHSPDQALPVAVSCNQSMPVSTATNMPVTIAIDMSKRKRKLNRIGLVKQMKSVMHEILDYSLLVKNQGVLQKFLGELEQMRSEASQNACLDPVKVQRELESNRHKRGSDQPEQDITSTSTVPRWSKRIRLSHVL